MQILHNSNFITLSIVLIITLIFLVSMHRLPKAHAPTRPLNLFPPLGRPLKAYILSAYFYPHSKSLGNNSLALVMSMNLGRSKKNFIDLQWGQSPDTTGIVVMARNRTSGVLVTTNYERITPHDNCQMVAIFATVQLLENPTVISLVSTESLTHIRYKTPPTTRREVVMCISPLYVSEQWQNFLLAAHIYKQFGAHMHVYLISAVTSFFELMQEYERSEFLTIQPWDRMIFPFVPGYIVDAYSQVEFQNLAAAQTDCLLQYKESAEFIALLELNDILIPKIAPTYIEEFQKIIENYNGSAKIAYIDYDRQHFEATIYNHSDFSIKDMMNSFVDLKKRSLGKVVLIPDRVNYTYIDRPTFLPQGYQSLRVEDNTLTYLDNIVWTEDDPRDRGEFFENSNFSAIYKAAFTIIESSLKEMFKVEKVIEINPELPNFYYFYDLVKNCFEERYYSILRSRNHRKVDNICPGPQLCGFYQHPDVKCVHVNAGHVYMKALYPITYYYSIDHYFSSDIGCYPH